MSPEDKKFQAEQDMRTLIEAAMIKSDKPRHTAAMKMVKEQRKALSEVAEKDDED